MTTEIRYAKHVVALAVALMAWGCSNTSSDSSAGKGASAKAPPAASAEPVAAAPAPAKRSDEMVEKPRQTPPSHVEPIRQTEPPTVAMKEPVVADTDDEKREQAANMIFAQIRLRMEEFIAERKKLLSEGKTRQDPRVHQLEGSILKARELLMEAGEMVEDVDPPIPTSNP